jgi:putative hydrolase of the HAD superfamily
MQNSTVFTDRHKDSPRIRAVILDYGQVLARSATREDFERMAKMFHMSFEVFYPLWESSRDIYDRGDLTPEEYWLKLAAQADTQIDHKQIEILRNIEIEIWGNVDQVMLDWVSQLRAAGLKTGLLSNMPRDLVTYLRANCAWIESFAFTTFSSEVGLIKPDPAIYEHTLHGLAVSASEALFVDDREINTRAAHVLGIHAIQFRSVAQLKSDLQVLGFPIRPADVETSAASAAGSPAETPGGEIKFQL